MNTPTRRRHLFELLGDGMAVLLAGKEVPRNRDTDYAFRQDSDFYYLTAFEEPESIAVFNPSHPVEKYVLFVRPRDRETETWVGRRAGVEGAVDRYGADAAYPLDRFDEKLREYLLGRPRLYCRADAIDRIRGPLGAAQAFHERDGRPVPFELHDLVPLLAGMRLRKDEAEVDLLRTAADITRSGHLEAMHVAVPGVGEASVQAAMEYAFRREGSQRNAYPSIVASGPNACILHYTENDREMRDGDLLLIDAAAEYRYMAADVHANVPGERQIQRRPGSRLRSCPRCPEGSLRGGRGRSEVRADAHHRPQGDHGGAGRDGPASDGDGGVSGDAPLSGVLHARDGTLAGHGRARRGRLQGSQGIENARTGHGVHREAAGYVEHPIPEALRGIGVRIEDDLLVTTGGYENLTASIPTALDEVEAACDG